MVSCFDIDRSKYSRGAYESVSSPLKMLSIRVRCTAALLVVCDNMHFVVQVMLQNAGSTCPLSSTGHDYGGS